LLAGKGVLKISVHASLLCRGNKTLLGVSDSMFHGIPEWWRATNIAFKGFDLAKYQNQWLGMWRWCV
jgi:hypothetical protein